jgi:hypothetical protein
MKGRSIQNMGREIKKALDSGAWRVCGCSKEKILAGDDK